MDKSPSLGEFLVESQKAARSRSDSSSSRAPTQVNASPRASSQTLTDGKSIDQRTPPKGEPVVKHGHTLTPPCGFREVCEAIKESAFVDNDLPIIISLEVHADWDQQEVMVRIMKDVWQDLLVTKPLEGLDPRFQIPTLDDLRSKILVKVKKAEPTMVAVSQALSHATTCDTSRDDGYDSDGLHVTATVSSSNGGTSTPTGRICPTLGDLAVYTRSEHFVRLETKEAKKPAHIFSISEKRILELYQRQAGVVFAHNTRYFMRAYPDKLRVRSTNLDPSLFWRRGVQMAAMNWQRLDAGMMVNEGMFADEKGWVLKPQGYRASASSSTSDKPAAAADGFEAAATQYTLDLHVQLFAGHNIPTDSDDHTDYPRSGAAIRPYVKVELHVEPATAGATAAALPDLVKLSDAGRGNSPRFTGAKSRLGFAGVTKVVPELSFVRYVNQPNPTHPLPMPLFADS